MFITSSYKPTKLMGETKQFWMQRIPCSWVEWLSTVNLLILPQVTYRFNRISTEIPGARSGSWCWSRFEKPRPGVAGTWWGRAARLEHVCSPASRLAVELQWPSPGVTATQTQRPEGQSGEPRQRPAQMHQLAPGEGVRQSPEKRTRWAFTRKSERAETPCVLHRH